MNFPRFLAVLYWLTYLNVWVHAEPPSLQLPTKNADAFRALISSPSSQPARITWDDYGCVANDPSVDNGPILSRMLAEQQNRRLRVPPVGGLADYHITTPIVWPNEHGGALLGSGGYVYAVKRRDIGCTRIVWTGPPGQPMIVYRGQGGRIGQLILQGAPLEDTSPVAGYGILVEAHGGRGDRGALPSGNLVTDQLAIVHCDAGIKCTDEPDANHADQMKHQSLLVHRCRVAYWVDCDQSVPHTFFAADFRNCKTGYRFDRGGALNVFGQYFASSQAKPTLLYVGKSTSNNGSFEISGLQVDASTKNLLLVDYGKYAHRVRVSGNVAQGATLADPPVRQRKGPSPYADVRIDCTGIEWPREGGR